MVTVARGNIEDQLLTVRAPESVSSKRCEDVNTTSQTCFSGQTEAICTLNFVAGALTARMKNDRAPVLRPAAGLFGLSLGRNAVTQGPKGRPSTLRGERSFNYFKM